MRRSTHPLEALCLIAVFAAAILFAVSVLQVYSIPYGIDFGEGYLANASQELIRGHNPYHSIDRPPWIVTSYPPLFPLLNGLLIAFVGPSLIPGRFIATASLIGIIVMMVLLMRKLNATVTTSILTAGILLVFPWPVNWSQVVRVDTLGILLVVSGIYIWLRSDRRSDTILSAVLFALAAFTKQSLLAAPIAVVIHALLSRDRRSLTLLLCLIVFIGGGYVLGNFLTGGEFVKHLFVYTANMYYWGRLRAGLGEYVRMTWLLQTMAISAFIMPGTLAGPKRLLGWYYVLAQITLFAYGFEGSDTNYYIEPLLSAAILAGLTLDRLTLESLSLLELPRGIPSPRTIGYALILMLFLGRFVDMGPYLIQRTNPERIRNGMEFVRLAAGTQGDILSEDASFTFLAGKPVLFQPYIMTLLSRTGKWDQSPFIRTIQEERYWMIILRVDLSEPNNTEVRGGAWEAAGFDRWTDDMEQAIKEHYSLYGGVDVGVGNLWYVYTPNSQNP